MRIVEIELISVSCAAATVPLLTCIAISWFANPRSLERRLILTRPAATPGAPGRWQSLVGSLGLWAVACGTVVVILHNSTSDAGPRLGAYRTGIAALLLFALAAVIILRRRIASALPHPFVHGASQHTAQHYLAFLNFPLKLSVAWSIKPKTWQRMHITVAIGAALPLWWHCDLGRASIADLLLKCLAISLLTSGFLGTGITDLTRWRLLSPMFSPRFSSGVIKALFAVHRGLALLAFVFITIHVLVVLYFAGV